MELNVDGTEDNKKKHKMEGMQVQWLYNELWGCRFVAALWGCGSAANIAKDIIANIPSHLKF